jgi:hypothetical protein
MAGIRSPQAQKSGFWRERGFTRTRRRRFVAVARGEGAGLKKRLL